MSEEIQITVFAALMGGVGCLIGVGVIAWHVLSWRGEEASRHWPFVEGIVIRSDVQRMEHVQRRKGPDRRSIRWMPVVHYRYSAGEEREGVSIRLQDLACTSERAAHDAIRRYPVGRKVRVFHDPKYVARSILEPGASSSWLAGSAFGAMVVAASLAVAVFIAR